MVIFNNMVSMSIVVELPKNVVMKRTVAFLNYKLARERYVTHDVCVSELNGLTVYEQDIVYLLLSDLYTQIGTLARVSKVTVEHYAKTHILITITIDNGKGM